MTVVYK